MSLPTGPQRLNLEQQRKRAKDLCRAHRDGKLAAALRIGRHLPRARNRTPEYLLASPLTLSEAQLVVAREAGFSSWPRLKQRIQETEKMRADSGELLIDAALSDDTAGLQRALDGDPGAVRRSIFAAAAVADAPAALVLLENDLSLADRRGGRRDWTPLLYLCASRYRRDDPAASASRLGIARRLLELGADINACGKGPGYTAPNVTQTTDEHEWFPVEGAAGHLGDPHLVRLLLDNGADLRKTSEVLSQAVRGGNAEVLRMLLAADPPDWQVGWALKECVVLDRKDLAGILAPLIGPGATNRPALMEAIRLERSPELIEILLGSKDSDALREVFRNTYRAAMRHGNRAAADLLRSRGADESAVIDTDRAIGACLDAKRSEMQHQLRAEDHRMLAWAIRSGKYNAVPLLIEAGLNPNVPDLDGETPLHLAVRTNALAVIDVLLQAGASADGRNFDGETPLDLAATRNDEAAIRRLLASGAHAQPPDSELERDEMNVLFEKAADAVAFGEVEKLREFLEREPALIHARSARPHRAMLLHYCGANGIEDPRQRTPANAADVLRLLLEHGSDVNATCNLYGGGITTLGLLLSSVFPIRAGLRTSLMEILVSAGAIVEGKRGVQGIAGAAALGRLDQVQQFFDASTGSPAPREVQAAFFWACEYGRTAVAAFLLEHGAQIAEQGENGMTALHLAAAGGHLETVQLLLRHEAPLELKNIWGGGVLGTTLWAAVESDPTVDFVPIVQTLIEAGAKVHSQVTPWWEEQNPLMASAKQPIADLLRRKQ